MDPVTDLGGILVDFFGAEVCVYKLSKVMASKYEMFISAINDKKIISVKVDSYEKGVIVRQCIPFDFGPSRRYKDNSDRYHMYDLDSPDGKHNLSITVDQLLEIIVTENSFEPADYVTWSPNWIVDRDWGDYS